MPLGPIELIVLSFPENRFIGDILPELEKVVQSGVITIVDGLFIRKDADGKTDYFEIGELSPEADIAALGRIMIEADGLISDEDVLELTASIAPNSSAAILAFEQTWVKPLRDAIVAAGGELVQDLGFPGYVADEVLAAVAEAEAMGS